MSRIAQIVKWFESQPLMHVPPINLWSISLLLRNKPNKETCDHEMMPIDPDYCVDGYICYKCKKMEITGQKDSINKISHE